MKSGTKQLLLISLLSCTVASHAAEISTGLEAGYNNGPALFFSGTAARFSRDLDLSARLGMGFTWLNPGNAADARRLFINDATDGSPEKGGGAFNIRFDLLFPLRVPGVTESYFYTGPRFSHFSGQFKYVGGNEEFNVTSSNWGFGLGMQILAPVSSKTAVVFDAGSDYFPPAALSGHDTSYAPDGDHVNARKNYTYKDADNAIRQPKYGLRLMIGLVTRLH